MFTERDEEHIYEGYKMPPTMLSEEDIGVIREAVNNKGTISTREREILQIKHIASFCGIEVTEIETFLYAILRKIMPQNIKEEQPSIPMWSLSDQSLVRHVLFITEGEGDRYRAITDTYPNIF